MQWCSLRTMETVVDTDVNVEREVRAQSWIGVLHFIEIFQVCERHRLWKYGICMVGLLPLVIIGNSKLCYQLTDQLQLIAYQEVGFCILRQGCLLCTPGWLQTQRSACLCLLSPEIKGMYHYHAATTYQEFWVLCMYTYIHTQRDIYLYISYFT